ncbi:MAG: hypothetical protein DI542_00775 [Acinetobacter johnsonii]|uniref:Peptidase S74 domain-containing protein n=1 Tax=Acinetobacter johnsonii TaxID=40214 RepID=A0A2W5TDM3_ACIJO|nr:MAG: hypothetical protein DI542_00775 [Acinetobacter johnsonii]
MSYYTKITKAGLAAITAAMNNNTKVPITYMAFGDGNGLIPQPDENATSLVNEVYRVGLNKVEVHNKNPNWLVCEAIIPSAVGGFNIREVALFDNTGSKMLAVASYPPTYKPSVEEGAAKIQTIRIVIQVDNSGNFELIVDPDVVLATVQYVNDSFIKQNGISILDFGAQADYNVETGTGFNNIQALKQAVDRAKQLKRGVVYIPSGDYYFEIGPNDKVNLGSSGNGIRIIGDGRVATKLYVKATNLEDVFIEISAGSAHNTNRGWRSMSILGAKNNNNYGIWTQYNGSCFSQIDDFYIGGGFVGVDYLNGTGNGTFCEFNILSNGRLDQNQINRRYQVNGGDNSFHGNDIDLVQNQIKPSGIGVQINGITKPAYLYNQFWLEHYFGGDNCTMLELDNCNTDHLSGTLTREGAVIIKTKSAYTKFHFNGDLIGIVGSTVFDLDGSNETGFGKIVFNNISSLSNKNFNHSSLLNYRPSPFKLGHQDRHYNGMTEGIYKIGEGIGFHCYYTSIGFQFNKTLSGNVLDAIPAWNLNPNGNYLKGFSAEVTIANNTKSIALNDTEFYGPSLKLGSITYGRWSGLYMSGIDFTYNALYPHNSNVLTLGTSSNTIKDIYLNNAPTVISDERHKSDIQTIQDAVLDAWGKVDFQMYKLNAEIHEKGSENARYHFGVIAQRIIDAFESENLDWRNYGLLTYEEWDAIPEVLAKPEVLDENGEVIQNATEYQAPKNAGEIYMVRYEECFALEMAYQRRLLNTLLNPQ